MTFVFMRIPLIVSHPAQPNAARADRKRTREPAWSCKIYLRSETTRRNNRVVPSTDQPRKENNVRDLGLETQRKLQDNERHPGR
jgi:hypothetical protein